MYKRLYITLFFFSFICLCWSEDFSGKCVAVIDGDTVDVMHNGKAERIRLEGIDAPEKSQAFGQKAKQIASSIVYGKDVAIQDKGKDKYGRTIGIVVIGNYTLNATMVRSGFAWHYKQYSKDPQLAQFEELARKEKKGLWQDPNPVAPWDYRHKGNVPADELTLASTGHTTKTQQVELNPNVKPVSNGVKIKAGSNYYGSNAGALDDQTNSNQPSYINGTPTGQSTATGMPIYEGPKGGHFHISKNGNKVYEKRK